MENTIANYAIQISVSLDPEIPSWKAWRLMKNNGITVVPVVHQQAVVGLVTHQDILRFANQNGGQAMPVREVMRPDPLIVSLLATTRQVINEMVDLKKEYAVVVDESGRFHGIFNWTDAMDIALNHG